MVLHRRWRGDVYSTGMGSGVKVKKSGGTDVGMGCRAKGMGKLVSDRRTRWREYVTRESVAKQRDNKRANDLAAKRMTG